MTRRFVPALISAVLLAAVLHACASAEKRKEPPPAAAAPVDAGAPNPSASAVLQGLAADYWSYSLRESPEYATILGEHAYDDRLDDISEVGRGRQKAALEGFLSRARAIDEGALTPQERITRALLSYEVQDRLDEMSHGAYTFDVDQLDGPQSGGFALLMRKYHPRETVQDLENLIARYRAFGPYVDAYLANLRQGLAARRTATKIVVRRVVEQLKEIVDTPPEKSFLLEPAAKLPAAATDEEKARLSSGINAAAKEVVLPAFAKLKAFLVEEYLPAAREQPGISTIPGGEALYAFLVRHHTTRTLAPAAIHQMGLDELKAVEAEMMAIALAHKHKKGRPLAEFTERLRKDPKNYAKDAPALLAVYRTALDKAKARAPEAFERMPSVDVEVTEMDPTRAPHAPAAYYEEADLKGARKAQFVANTFSVSTRPLFNAEALTYHEAIPGHHVQIGLAHDLGDIPEFRRTLGFSAFVEGWALYAEKLADELGLYGSPYARYGYLGFRAWRAARLVVDTGIHALGWSRQQAVDFMRGHTTLGQADIDNEVDRYIMWPAQALGYMVGALELDALRKESEGRMGSTFDRRRFHSAVLWNGALPLEMLSAHVLGQAPSPDGGGAPAAAPGGTYDGGGDAGR